MSFSQNKSPQLHSATALLLAYSIYVHAYSISVQTKNLIFGTCIYILKCSTTTFKFILTQKLKHMSKITNRYNNAL